MPYKDKVKQRTAQLLWEGLNNAYTKCFKL